MNKILITDDVHPIMIEKFQYMGFSVDYLPEITYLQTLDIINQYTGLIVNTKIKADKILIDKAEKLQFIGRIGSGMEHIDKMYAAEKNIGVFSSPEGNSNAVGEHALGMLLSLFNNLCKANNEVRNGIWQREPNRGVELEGKIIGIIGYGHTGAAFAKKLSGFDCEVIAYDKYKKDFSDAYVQEVDYADLLSKADVISFHVPLTAETKHMVNTMMISSVSNNFYVVNTSRGGVINTVDLITALQQGKVLGAALDVFENENYYNLDPQSQKNFQDLSTMNNVLMTPHIAGWTRESKWKLAEILTNKIKDFLG